MAPCLYEARASTNLYSKTNARAGSCMIEAKLTRREQEIYALVIEGISNAEVGERLFIDVRTVKFHMTRILAKLELKSRTEMIARHYKLLLAEKHLNPQLIAGLFKVHDGKA